MGFPDPSLANAGTQTVFTGIAEIGTFADVTVQLVSARRVPRLFISVQGAWSDYEQ
jgi:hypothetical protein